MIQRLNLYQMTSRVKNEIEYGPAWQRRCVGRDLAIAGDPGSETRLVTLREKSEKESY
jgi:hypothetical protein